MEICTYRIFRQVYQRITAQYFPFSTLEFTERWPLCSGQLPQPGHKSVGELCIEGIWVDVDR